MSSSPGCSSGSGSSRSPRPRPPRLRATRPWSTRSRARTRSPATPRASGTSAAPASDDHPGLRHRHQRQRRRDGPVQDQHAGQVATGSTSTAWATTAANGARKVATVNPSATLPQNQPACLADAHDRAGRLRQLGGVGVSWAVPTDAVSGIYFAKLVRTDGTTGASHIVFVVRDDASTSDLLFQTSDTTWQAYNPYGGNSLYVGIAGRAARTRSATTGRSPPGGTGPEDFVFNAEYPMVRCLEANGYDVSYIDRRRHRPPRRADPQPQDVPVRRPRRVLVGRPARQRRGGPRRRRQPRLLQRQRGRSGRPAGRPASTARARAYRTLVTYKETHANAVIDPADPPTWTGTWRDPRFSPPADGGRPRTR